MNKKFLCPIWLLLFFISAAAAQSNSNSSPDSSSGSINPAPPQGATVEQIIQRFAAKEKDFKIARDHYTYRQSVKVQTLDGSAVDGEFQMVSDILFDNQGKRIERVLYAPQSTLQRVEMSKEDYADIQDRMPFVLTTEEIPEYQILYVGQQHVDELDTYVFDLAPRQILKDHRYFQGRIWVDNQDLQIVKTYGKIVPETKNTNPKKNKQENLFPRFTTYREQIDGKYWFPTYTRADDVLHFSDGQDVHLRIIVKYTDYHRFGADVKITFEGQDISNNAKTQSKNGTAAPAK